MSIGIGTAVAASAGGSMFGSIGSAIASESAASDQEAAANNAIALQQQMFSTTQQNLSPFIQGGATDLGTLNQKLSSGALGQMPSTWGMSGQFSPTMASLAQTPGYQFTLQQGLQGVTNAYAAQGLGGSISGGKAGPSGPLGAGLTSYASGLAANTFNQQYQNWLAGQQLQLGQQQQEFNMYSGLAGLGESAAAGQGQISAGTANAISGNITSAGAAQAAGIVGATNALNQGIGGASNAGLLLALTNNAGIYGAYGTGGL